MRTPCCHSFVAFILKFLIFFQTFIGISIIVYSAYMLNQWEKHLPIPPSPAPPSPSDLAPAPSPDSSDSFFNIGKVSDQVIHLNFEAGTITGIYGGIQLESDTIPAPWFIYAFMGLGIVLCCISCIGHIAAEAIHGCCLCFYTILKIVLILLEVALIAFIALDHRWEKDIPEDPTGRIDNIREFIEDNADICKWVGITIVAIQVLCILLAVVLGMMVSSQKKDEDIEEGSGRGRAWEPLLNPNSNQASGSTSADGKSFHSDIWSSRIREKLDVAENFSGVGITDGLMVLGTENKTRRPESCSLNLRPYATNWAETQSKMREMFVMKSNKAQFLEDDEQNDFTRRNNSSSRAYKWKKTIFADQFSRYDKTVPPYHCPTALPLSKFGKALKSEVLRLKEEMFLVDAGLGTARMSMQDEPKGVPINRATRFENKSELPPG
ncbi:hypothetical protein E3N88_21945 [Mikania micrantha]|uniref:Uncharacterized protein n=1 Tax=Mikania micrantha TaxID=192012 RepID=A0A5N6N9D3_9ASTR|nr:hypothetical protein E3N88_21945 [Mikania micrantha]